MLVILRDAMFCIAAHPDPAHPELCVVRARVRGDIERVWPMAKPRTTPSKDYPYRANMPRYVIDRELRQAVAAIDYRSFGAAIEDAHGEGSDRLAIFDAVADEWAARAEAINAREDREAAERLLAQARAEEAAA